MADDKLTNKISETDKEAGKEAKNNIDNEREKIDKWRELVLKEIEKPQINQAKGVKLKDEKTSKIIKKFFLKKKEKTKPIAKKQTASSLLFEKEPLSISAEKISAKPIKKPVAKSIKPTEVEKTGFLKKIFKFIIVIVLSLCFFIFLIIIFFGIGLYKYGWNDKYTNQLMKVVPYPVAIINGKMISYSEFRSNVSALNKYYHKQEQITSGIKMVPPIEKIQEDVLRRMITNEIISQLAEKYRISVSQEEVNQKFQEISRDAGGEKQIKDIIKDLYGWDEETYKKRVLAVSLLVEKLDNFLSSNSRHLEEVLRETQSQAEVRRFFY